MGRGRNEGNQQRFGKMGLGDHLSDWKTRNKSNLELCPPNCNDYAWLFLCYPKRGIIKATIFEWGSAEHPLYTNHFKPFQGFSCGHCVSVSTMQA